VIGSLVQTKPRSVFCVTEHLHRDFALAEQVCAGQFTHAGLTLTLGAHPDWLTSSFPDDAEWRIEWSKFYYGLDLAAAFNETGDLKFLIAWEDLVRTWIEQVPVDIDPADVTARRIQNWICAWDHFAAAPAFPGFTEGFANQLFNSLAAQVEHLRLNLAAERNHRTLELYALFVAALALPQLDDGGELLRFSIEELHRNLLADIREDGVHREHSTHYHMIVLRSFIAARINTDLFGLAFPDSFDRRLERACEFALHAHRPDGVIPALSDSDSGSYLDVLQLAGAIFSRADFFYVASKGRVGTPPSEKYVSFSEAGYFIQRSGWGENQTAFADERFLIFDCGPLGDGGHGHYDALSIEVAAGGGPLIVDPGRFTYHEDKLNWRHWFKSTTAHNTVCVDSLDQTPYRRGKPKGPTAEAQLIERLSAPNFDLLCGRVTSPSYDAVHTRFIFFIAGEYWVIVDQLSSDVTHNYDLRFHLAPEAMNHTAIRRGNCNNAVIAPGMALVFPPATQPQLEPGWVSPQYGHKISAPVVSVRSKAAEECFFTLVMPLELNDSPPAFRVLTGDGVCSGRICFEVTGVGQNKSEIDRVGWAEGAERFALGTISGTARATWARASALGNESVVQACEVSSIACTSDCATELLPGAGPLSWIVWNERFGLTHSGGPTR
jgi:heparinase II/III-like protein